MTNRLEGQEPIGTKTELNGWQNLGKLAKHAFTLQLTQTEYIVYMKIGEYSLGMCQAIALPKDESNSFFTVGEWASSCNIGVATWKRTVKSLVEKNLITQHKGSHYRQNGGSYPDTYSIKFNKDKVYFNIARTSEHSENKKELTFEDLLKSDKEIDISKYIGKEKKLAMEHNKKIRMGEF